MRRCLVRGLGLSQQQFQDKKALHLKQQAAPSGREVTYRMLNDRFAKAREQAAVKASSSELAAAIRAMIQRDCRKYAADLAETSDDAQHLLQHGNKATTLRHYRTVGPSQADAVNPENRRRKTSLLEGPFSWCPQTCCA